MKLWNAFAEKHPAAAQWVREADSSSSSAT